MFFDEGNCRAVRLLHEASSFLEASLEKLLALEQEALSQLDVTNRNGTNSESVNPVAEISQESKEENLNIECKPNPLSIICNRIESTSNSEHNNHQPPGMPQKIRKLPPVTPESSLKRKDTTVQSNECSKKRKCEQKMHQADEEESENVVFYNKPLKTKNDGHILEHDSESIITNIKIENDVDDPVISQEVISSNFTCDPVNVNLKPQGSSELKSVSLLEDYFKVRIKFKESLPYETVEKLIKSVGLEDVFDIVLTKKLAEVTFLNESSMKKALHLHKDAMKRLKASEIQPIKKHNYS